MLAYLRLLIRNRLSAFNPNNLAYGQSGGKNRRLRGILYIFLYLFAFASVMFLFVMLEGAIFKSCVAMGEPEVMLAVLFLLCVLIVLITGFFFIFSSLYFGKDAQMVAALPISDRGVLAARVIMVLISEAAISLLFCIPAIIMYGSHIGAGIMYYLRVILFVPLLPVIPVGIITLLSFLLIRISALWKRREGVTVVFSFLFIALVLILEMRMTSNMDKSDMDAFMMQLMLKQRQLITDICALFPPVGWLTKSLSGTGIAAWGNGLLFAAVSAGLLAVVIFATGGKYQQLVIKQSEALARLNSGKKRGNGKDRLLSPRTALYVAEVRDVITTPIYAMNGLCGVLLFPLLLIVALLSSGGNAAGGLGAIKTLISGISPTVFMGVWTAILCFTCTMNMALFTAVSREGKRNYVSRIIPVAPSEQLQAKLLMGLSVNGLIALLMSIAIIIFYPSMWAQVLCAVLIGTIFSVLSCSAGLAIDALRPRYQWKNETEAIKQNINGVLSMFLTLIMTAVFALIFFLLLKLSLSPAMCYAIVSALIVISAAFAYRFLMGKVAQRYYLQEFAN